MVKRSLLAAAIALSGCVAVNSLSNHGLLVLKPQISAGGYGTQTQIAPYTQSSIHHLILKLYTFDVSEHDQGIQRTLFKADLTKSVTFTNLKPNLTYRVKAYAYASTDESVLISTGDSNSYTDIVMGTDDRPTIGNLKVKLIDRDFNGQATASGIAVTPGGYQWTGPENMRFICRGVVSTYAGGTGGNAFGYQNGIGTAALFWNPTGIAIDSSNNIYLADRASNLIRKITPAAVVSTLAGGGGGTISGYADGMGTSALFFGPQAIAVDAQGNVYVADSSNNVIRKITSAGMVSTLAGAAGTTEAYVDGAGTSAMFGRPSGLTLDIAGNLYVADEHNSLIRKITSAGIVSTIAGGGGGTIGGYSDGTGTAAKFNMPRSLAVDGLGNVFVGDYFNHLIRKITSDGVVSTFAGGGGAVSAGYLNGTGTAAKFNAPWGIVFDSAGYMYVSDSGNNLIRIVR